MGVRAFGKTVYLAKDYVIIHSGPSRWMGKGQIAPRVSRGFIAPYASRSGGLINQTSSTFQKVISGCKNVLLASLAGVLFFLICPEPLNYLWGPECTTGTAYIKCFRPTKRWSWILNQAKVESRLITSSNERVHYVIKLCARRLESRSRALDGEPSIT